MSAISLAAASGRDFLTDLPHDVFLLIVSLLSSKDAVVCRGVSRAWHRSFTAEHVSSQLLRWHFLHARESRTPRATAATTTISTAAAFARVTRRYHHLRTAKPRLIEKIDTVREADQGPLHRGVEPWNRKLRFNDNTAAFQYRDPTWCMDDGLLVYPSPDGRYLAYDVATRRRFHVPFDSSDKTVRRLRLACGVLIIEWCEREPYHELNDRETVHRHFATAYDVLRPSSCFSSRSPQSSIVRSSADASTWAVVFRSEWKIHFLGLPVNQHDRFFSAHSATTYALYLWQPNRSPWGEEEPLEQLTIWDISFPSAYRPSEDPTGSQKPDADLGPVITRRLSWRDLEFLGLRQRHTPSIRQLLLDGGHVYVHAEDHRWLSGPHSSLSLPRHHTVRSTGIPIVGLGPCWYDECCADGDLQMSFCPRSGSAAPGDASSSCRDRSSRWAPCWRHEEFPYLTVTDMVDDEAGVRIVARQCFMMEALSVFVAPRISVEHEHRGKEGSEVRFADDMWSEVLNKGCIYGDERWMVGEDGQGRITVVRF